MAMIETIQFTTITKINVLQKHLFDFLTVYFPSVLDSLKEN